jgi:hypothetical protein
MLGLKVDPNPFETDVPPTVLSVFAEDGFGALIGTIGFTGG